MKESKQNGGYAGYVMIALLTGMLGVGIWLLPESEPTFGDVDDEREDLIERWESYIELRRADEWVAIYDEYIDPAQHELMGRSAFLASYDTGHTKVREVQLGDVEIDARGRKAALAARIQLELVPANLPPTMRINPNDPSQLVRTMEKLMP